MAQTIAARFFHPPERESTGLSRYSSSPKKSERSCILASRSFLPIMWYMAWAIMFSLMVRSLSSETCCWMTPILSFASIGFFFRSNPSTVMVPESKFVSVAMHLTVVVLPAPFGPRKPNSSPSRTLRLRWSTAVLSSNLLTRSSITIMSLI